MKHIKSFTCIKNYRPKPLTLQSHTALSKVLSHFKLNQTHLSQEYLDTLQKMNRIGIIADKIDHHPQWTLNADNLNIGLSTHEIGGQVSMKDYILGFWIQYILNQQSLQQQLVKKWNNFDIKYD